MQASLDVQEGESPCDANGSHIESDDPRSDESESDELGSWMGKAPKEEG